VIAGASKVTENMNEPTRLLTRTVLGRSLPVPALGLQTTVVCETQTMVPEVVAPTCEDKDVSAPSSTPKLTPEMVTAALPEVGEFVTVRTVMTGLSNVKKAANVPLTEKSATDELKPPPVPGCTAHKRTVLVTQDVVAHLVRPTFVVGVRFSAPNSDPKIVRRTTGSAEVAVFVAPVASDTTGAS